MSVLNKKLTLRQCHWLRLSTADWREVWAYIRQLEQEYQRMEAFVGEVLSARQVADYYDFGELGWGLFKDLAYLGLVEEGFLQHNWDKAEINAEMNFERLDYLQLCDLLVFMTQEKQISSGFFDMKLKDKTMLRLLQGVQKKVGNK